MGLMNRQFRFKAFTSTLALTAGLLTSSGAFAADPFQGDHGPLKVNLMSLTDFTPAEKDKMYQAAEVLERVMNSDEFRQAVVNFTYEGKKQFVNNKGLTNEQIYETIRRGSEVLIGKDDETMDYDLTLYTPPFWKKRTVVGYTYSNTLRIWVNRYYFTDFTLAEVAANLAHEWCHKIGFEHDFQRTASRPNSVPYAVGRLVGQIAAKMLGISPPGDGTVMP